MTTRSTVSESPVLTETTVGQNPFNSKGPCQ
jgi:hypothetical protein